MTSTEQYGQVYRADFFASIFDIGGEFERNNQSQEAYGGAFGLRVLGTSAQSTNLVARYGWRRLNSFAAQEHWENQYAEALLRLYVFSFFGLDGGYRHYFKSKSNLGNVLSGHRASAGTFLELSIIRIYGSFFWEPVPVENTGVVSKHERDGYEAGITLIF